MDRRWLPLLLLLVLVYLQAQLWFGEGSREEVTQLQRQIAEQKAANAEQEARNQRLRDDIHSLKTGYGSIESKARSELGLVKPDEEYYLIVNDPAWAKANTQIQPPENPTPDSP